MAGERGIEREIERARWQERVCVCVCLFKRQGERTTEDGRLWEGAGIENAEKKHLSKKSASEGQGVGQERKKESKTERVTNSSVWLSTPPLRLQTPMAT